MVTIRFYVDEEPIPPNVPTLNCNELESRRFVLANLDALVVKPADGAGGVGVLIGHQATSAELAATRASIEDEPQRWIAQPTVPLSTAPTLCDGEVAPRHVDLRPFTLLGPEGAYVTQGGLTRVARRAGSLVVNSSQGGGSKDTWVVGPSSATEPERSAPPIAHRDQDQPLERELAKIRALGSWDWTASADAKPDGPSVGFES